MRFVHTADWQIGMRAAHLGRAAETVRDARIAALYRIGKVARDAGADFVLVAGDVFEHHGVDRVLVQRTADALGSMGVPVFLLPGNHDPLVPGSVWEHRGLRELRAKGVEVLADERAVEAPGGGWLYPCPALSRTGDEDPTKWIPRREHQGEVRVGVAHGTVGGEHLEEPYFPIARDAWERAGLDYLALGHFHSTGYYKDAGGAVRMAYSGTHEGTRFGERDAGNVLVVDVPGPGVAPQVTPVRVGEVRWVSLERSLAAPGDVARLSVEVDRIEEPARTVLRLSVEGVLFAVEQSALLHLGQRVSARFLHAKTEVFARPSPEDSAWLDGLPAGPVRAAAEALRAQAQAGGPKGEVAAMALLELFSLADELSGDGAPGSDGATGAGT